MNSLKDAAQNPLGALSGLGGLASMVPGLNIGGALGALGKGSLAGALNIGGSAGDLLNKYGPALFGAYAAKQAFPNAFKPYGTSGFNQAMQGVGDGMAGLQKNIQEMTGWAGQMGDFAAQNLPGFPNQPVLRQPGWDVPAPAQRSSQVFARGVASANRAADSAGAYLPAGASMPGLQEGLRLQGQAQAQAQAQAQRAADDEAMRLWRERQYEAERQRRLAQHQADLANVLNEYQGQMDARRQKAAELSLRGDALGKTQGAIQGSIASQMALADIYRQLMLMSTEQQKLLLGQFPELLSLLSPKGALPKATGMAGSPTVALPPGADVAAPGGAAPLPPWATRPGWWGDPQYQWVGNLRFR